MPADIHFMAWIDYLPEVGDPIRRERAKLHELAKQGVELEHHAATLFAQMRAGQAGLLTKTMKHWTLADIQAAAEAAERADPMRSVRARVEDADLSQRLMPQDGWHLASEALQAFETVVIRHHNHVSAGTEEERAQTLARVLAWWNYAGRPVCERLTVK